MTKLYGLYNRVRYNYGCLGFGKSTSTNYKQYFLYFSNDKQMPQLYYKDIPGYYLYEDTRQKLTTIRIRYD